MLILNFCMYHTPDWHQFEDHTLHPRLRDFSSQGKESWGMYQCIDWGLTPGRGVRGGCRHQFSLAVCTGTSEALVQRDAEVLATGSEGGGYAKVIRAKGLMGGATEAFWIHVAGRDHKSHQARLYSHKRWRNWFLSQSLSHWGIQMLLSNNAP